mmetsp:Transcript_2786/g.6646  ORF Transcript_2786/g.6646 Transcript_2786/m.6646 type:complete len:109 (+) Transcript_2786:282-608(+)
MISDLVSSVVYIDTLSLMIEIAFFDVSTFSGLKTSIKTLKQIFLVPRVSHRIVSLYFPRDKLTMLGLASATSAVSDKFGHRIICDETKLLSGYFHQNYYINITIYNNQ